MEFEEKTIKSELIYDGKVTKYIVEDVLLPNGKQSKREIVRHDGAAAIIAFTDDQKLLLVKQYRKAIEKISIEIPAGLKDAEYENGLKTAKRELEEETGFQAQVWSFITSFYSTPGFTDEFLEIYEARQLIKVDNPLPKDEDETIEVLALTFEEAWHAYEEGHLRDSKSVFALFYWKMKKIQGFN
ncbi:NUDIX hydrolase [Marinilactibacillus psychrotolerans]|uniref:NUDIX hydrolase n=2 Tax=Marinilactibacillus psychrotolerans TaxID=191770 RepID=A0A5R9C4E8_9LACT|nr:NUDIX hydrolase [Marinilactibacillus psychrotolerans]TLQ07724.1 NUDIX hydrolase [Marinilactibacillus psychrotolerans]SJN21893.1 ADP-ribose pyrophosphatase [Marinilactibacillus psychrotolerans 42ea]